MSHRLRYNGACSRQKAMARAEIRGWFMNRQDRANAVDREVSARLLPEAALEALGGWWGQNAVRLTDGTPSAHTVRYTPSRWAHITTWPSMMASTFQAGDADVSRTQVASIVADALERGAYEEALVATYVWGKGKSGSPAGSGPATLHKILLGTEGLNAILASVVNTLREQDAEAAYAELRGRIAGFGPSFYSKFLYFAGKSVRAASGTQPLILDQVLARRMRSLAQAVGRETGYDPDGSIARWVWRDTNWSPHRYAIYLSFMQAASRQVAATHSWPSNATPDLLEYALFTTSWVESAEAT